jgi:hypothetical protein
VKWEATERKPLQSLWDGQYREVCGFSLFQGFSVDCSVAVFCWLFNTGSNTVTVSSRQIFSTDGGFTNRSVAPTSDGCRNPLGAEKGCQFSASTGAEAVAFTCRAVISGAEENVSGTMQILSPTSQLLLSIPMKK